MTLRTAAPQAAQAGEEDEDPTLPGIAAPEPPETRAVPICALDGCRRQQAPGHLICSHHLSVLP